MGICNRRHTCQATVVATMILIGSSMLMTSIVLFWSQNVTGQFGTSTQQNISLTNLQASEQFSIDEVLFRSGSTKIYVRNFGDIIVRIVGVYVFDSATGGQSGGFQLSSPVVVNPRSVSAITVSFDPASFSGSMVTIRVASERGNQFEESFKVG